MGSVKKVRTSSNNIQETKESLTHDYISFLLSFIGILVMMYIGLKYMNAESEGARLYGNYSLFLAILGTIGYIFMDIMDNNRLNIIHRNLKFLYTIKYAIFTLVTFISLMIAQFIIAVSIRFAISDTDMVLYYLFAGICEELFFRAFLIGIMIYIRNKKFTELTKIQLIVSDLLIITISSFAFMFAHISVYGNSIQMMVMTLVSGYILGYSFIWSKRISVPQSAHLGINIVAVRNVLVSF